MRNLEVATKSIPEFKLGGPVVEMEGGKAKLVLGKKEGIRLDDRMYAAEFSIDESGKMSQDNVGFLRISSVSDNREVDALSTCSLVGGTCDVGMLLIENPRLGLDITAGFGISPLGVSAGTVDDTYYSGLGLIFDEALESTSNCLTLDARYNLAPLVNLSQLFAGIGVNLGWAAMENAHIVDYYEYSDPPDIPSAFVLDVEGTLLKKLYWRRFALLLGAGITWNTLNFDYSCTYDDYSLTFSAESIGFKLDLGMEFALTANLNLGAGAVYKSLGSSFWRLRDDLYVDRIYDEFGAPEVDFSGTALRFWLTYSPPALSFDPFSMFRGRLGI